MTKAEIAVHVEAGVREILDPGPWRVVRDYITQGYALWEVQGKSRDKPWLPAKRRRGVQQCTGCGAIFGGVNGFAKHRTGMRCNDPSDIGLRRSGDGVWLRPVPIFRDADGVKQHVAGEAMQEATPAVEAIG